MSPPSENTPISDYHHIMKYGDTLLASKVDAWSDKYIDYKALKKCIKQIVQNDELGKCPFWRGTGLVGSSFVVPVLASSPSLAT